MSGESKLEEKAATQDLGSPEPKRKKPPKLIIGTADHSTSSFVKEQTIEIDPDVGPRGGSTGTTIGARPMAPRTGRSRITTHPGRSPGYTPRSTN
jgi:hypothetical protein